MIDEEPRGSHCAITKIIYSLLIAIYGWLTTIYIFLAMLTTKIVAKYTQLLYFQQQEKNLKLTQLL